MSHAVLTLSASPVAASRARVRRAGTAITPLLLLVMSAGLTLESRLAPAGVGEAATASRGDGPMKIAETFIAMVNDGSEEAVRAFEASHRSAKNRAAVSLPDRLKRMQSMKAEFGTLTIDQVVSADDSGVSLVCKAAHGQTVGMDFMFDTSDGGRLDGVMVSVGGEEARPRPLTPEVRTSTIEGACRALEEGYVYPDVAAKMAEKVRAKLKAGGYDSIKTETVLARQLTDDLRSVSHDGHLRVNVSPEPPKAAPAHDDALLGMGEDEARKDNYAFRKVEMLPGNIGYVRFDLFANAEGARVAGSAAMAFVRNADAIIFDMRYNGGGSPEFIQYITSYLFDQKTHLNDMVDRNGAMVSEYWTLPEVPGQRIPMTTPIYVLTSHNTFSGAEEFTYNLKNLKRAKVVGETTGGGAHPVRGERLNDRFMIGVPFMRAQSPITKTNWEGTGVEPDIKVSADEALERAVKEIGK